ncbi:MAG: GGDEF and EAL domain-containing protein [Clostridia bacterium]|nr:GGDEF and EAL domain-containing protein [Clostridia bacterium]
MEKYTYSQEERAILESLAQPLAIYQIVDKRVVTLVVSDGFCRLLGYETREQTVYDMDHDMYKDTHPDDRERIASAAMQFAKGGADAVYDVVFRTKAGVGAGYDYQVVHAHGQHVYPEPDVQLAQVWYMDEGEYREGDEASATGINQALNSALHEESILKASRYDALTGLPNLAWFFTRSEIEKARLQAENRQGVLLYIDLSGMKYFNHQNGFAEGDKLLKALANVLESVFGKENSCHIGADRFAAAATEELLPGQLERFRTEVLTMNDGNTLPVRVGVYSTAIEDVPISTAYDRAKMSCDAIRKTDVLTVNYYSAEVTETVRRKQYIEQNIDKAVKERWIQVYYQPIVRAMSQRVCNEEALARWIDPKEGFLSPAEFIPQLENAGLIYKLDLCVLEQVLEKMTKQAEEKLVVPPHSINLSRSDFETCDIVEEIRKRVDDFGIPRSKICIEITESVIGSDFDFMKEQVERFRGLGFPVWMDDFGSGYSSLDVLQSIEFDLIKFDMSFMRKLDQNENAKIILTELMKMATSLGVDTVCEGVETEDQALFLQEIGCSKLQGFYFCKPISYAGILERYETGKQIGFEDPDTAGYYETVGRVNLYDLSVIASQDEYGLQNSFSTLPMGIIEIKGDSARFVRSNPSYREFMKRFFNMDISGMMQEYQKYSAAFTQNVVRACCELGVRSFYNETMPDGSVVHTFARRIGANTCTGEVAVAVAVLSITDPGEGESYADIARALAADYYNIYVVDLDTEYFIEYTSPVGQDKLAEERHGTDFFEASRQATMTRIYEDDRELFLTWFTKENVIRELDEHGVFTTVYRLIDTGEPVYAHMKITRMQGTNRIILGVSIIDSQMKQQRQIASIRRERDTLAKVMAITEDYLSLYSVDPETGHFIEYSATSEYETLHLAKEGDDFFRQGAESGKKTLYPEDVPKFLTEFTKENVLKVIEKEGRFVTHYRLMLEGVPQMVSLKIAPYNDGVQKTLLAGVRKWRVRK